jgi:hypothetical protein
MNVLRCPKCRFALRPRASYLTLDFCPRCLARTGVAVGLVGLADASPADPPLTVTTAEALGPALGPASD